MNAKNLQQRKTNAGNLLEEETRLAKEINEDYNQKYGFKDSHKATTDIGKGISEEIIRQISGLKNEDKWMLDLRLKAYRHFMERPMPTWGADLSGIDFDNIHYFVRATDKQGRDWNEVPDEIKNTFERLGIPQAERKFLAGVATQYESEVIYHNMQKKWNDLGVLFLDTDSAYKQFPEIFREHFGKIIPYSDNKFAALNTAVWSGGSFIYVPKGVKVTIPLQAYFRINAQNMGQFERTLIIADEDSEVHYIEGCFTKGTLVQTSYGPAAIEDITTHDMVLTHTGEYRKVNHTQVRDYTGDLYTIRVRGNVTEEINATEEHPFLIVRRKRSNERNNEWNPEWVPIKDVRQGDYACVPVDKTTIVREVLEYPVLRFMGSKKSYLTENIKVPCTNELFRLIGYYLAEGSISNGHYLNFSFGSNERELIDDVKNLIEKVFNEKRVQESVHKKNNGISVVVSSTKLCRFFEQFGTSSSTKSLPDWVMYESKEKQKELLTCWYLGDGNYYNKEHKHGLKEVFRICTTSEELAYQGRSLLARVGVASGINIRERKNEGRKTMYTVVVGGEYAFQFGKMVGIKIPDKLNGKKRATIYNINDNYLYAPIKEITKKKVKKIPVYNFSVEKDESYVAGGVAVHNCTAPTYTTDSLHSAVVEIVAKKRARVRYTTIQNWSSNVYNLVTKRAIAYQDAIMEWVDCNLGSKVTMKYPSVYLVEPGAHGEVLSIALAGKGQYQDAGGKIIHRAPNTSSVITSKSICKDGGRTSYRGLLRIAKGAKNSKSTVICDALILDNKSRTDTYPTNEIAEKQVSLGHEASVSKVNEEQLFYLMSRGLSESEAAGLIVSGFIEPILKELPMEYAMEMNALIQMSMEGSVG